MSPAWMYSTLTSPEEVFTAIVRVEVGSTFTFRSSSPEEVVTSTL